VEGQLVRASSDGRNPESGSLTLAKNHLAQPGSSSDVILRITAFLINAAPLT